MTHSPDQPLSLQLPPDTYDQVVRGLQVAPIADTPDSLAHRDRATIAQVASLLPVSSEEAHLGASMSPPAHTRPAPGGRRTQNRTVPR